MLEHDTSFTFSGLEGSVVQVSDQGLRKVLYQKVGVKLSFPPSTTHTQQSQIVATFPEGWMSSGHISRDGTFFSSGHLGCGLTLSLVSAMKKKLEKEAMEQDDDHWLIQQCIISFFVLLWYRT